jgi:hypothetical protein
MSNNNHELTQRFPDGMPTNELRSLWMLFAGLKPKARAVLAAACDDPDVVDKMQYRRWAVAGFLRLTDTQQEQIAKKIASLQLTSKESVSILIHSDCFISGTIWLTLFTGCSSM